MPMTDAPNFGTKFGWRKPCLRYIGPLLRTASVASAGRGDYTPPSWTHRPAPLPPVGGAGSVPPRGPLFYALRQFLLVLGYHSDRVGVGLCVRPDTLSRGTRSRADTQVGPYKTSICPPTGRGRSPAPTGLLWCQAAGRRSRTPAPAKAAQPDRSARDPRPAIPRRVHSQLSIINFPPKNQAPARGLVLGRRFFHVLSLEMGSRKMSRRMALPSKGTRG